MTAAGGTTGAAATADTVDGAEYPRRWPALFACVITLFMTLLDVSIVIVALPTIASSLHASASSVQWTVSAYALAFGVVPIIAGRLGDDHGRKRMLMVGSVAFVVMSVAAGFAPTIGILIAARVLQGLAGGLLNPQVSGVVQQMFAPHDRGRAFGAIGITVGVATASGPVIGGLIIGLGGSEWGWRLCFLVNLPIGIVSLIASQRLVPGQARNTTTRTRGLDLVGAVLLAVGLFAVLFPFVQYDASRNALLALVLVPAALLLAAFWKWERGPARARGHPLIDIGLFKIRSFTAGTVLAVFYFVAYTGTPLVLSLFLQEGLGYSALQSGLTATAYAVGSALSAAIGGRLVGRLGSKLLIGALILFVVGVALAAALAATFAGHVDSGHLAWVLVGPLFVAGFGGGSVITPNQALSLVDIDARGGSTAGGMLQTGQRVGAAISTAVVSATFYAAVAGASPSGRSRFVTYGDGYAIALGVSVVFALCALGLAIFDVRRSGRRSSPVPDATAAATG